MTAADPYSVDFDKQRFLVEASLHFVSPRSHALITGVVEDVRPTFWTLFARTLRRLTVERLAAYR